MQYQITLLIRASDRGSRAEGSESAATRKKASRGAPPGGVRAAASVSVRGGVDRWAVWPGHVWR